MLLIVVTISWRRDFYSKLGTNHLAISAGKTPGLIINYWQEIPFRIQLVTHFKDISGTELNTIAATLAPFLIYIDLAYSSGYLSIIERFSPEFHNPRPHRKCSKFTALISSKLALMMIGVCRLYLKEPVP